MEPRMNGQKLFTRTQHYRKVTKPLLERKRRARMNLYLDELKDIIVDAMEAQGEHVAKLEKADILEMTVTYLRARVQANAAAVAPPPLSLGGQQEHAVQHNWNAEKFRAGYAQATLEVSKIFAALPDLDAKFKTSLFKCVRSQLEGPDRRVLPAGQKSRVRPAEGEQEEEEDDNADAPAQPLKKSKTAAAGAGSADDVWRPW